MQKPPGMQWKNEALKLCISVERLTFGGQPLDCTLALSTPLCVLPCSNPVFVLPSSWLPLSFL